MNMQEIKDLPLKLRLIVASAHVMGEYKQDILFRAADAIEELLAAVPKWISVDRNNLPGHEVIAVNAKPGSYGYKEMLVGMVFYSEEERFFACESDDGIILVNVTHYMEKPSLPHPPKGVE